MPIDNVVFVFGAGSNMDYGFFDNEGLMRYCAYTFPEKLKNNKQLADQLEPAQTYVNKLATILMPYNHHESMDHVLSLHKDLQRAGKLAIADAILFCERQVKSMPPLVLYRILFKFLTMDHKGSPIKRPEDLHLIKDNTATFITFNYDRSLEHYFNTAFESFASNFYYEVPTYYIHGSIGPYNKSTFGLDIDSDGYNLADAAKGINILYENRDLQNFSGIYKALQSAKALFFLGFHFDEDNLNLFSSVRLKN
jgi:hypothetical protein